MIWTKEDWARELKISKVPEQKIEIDGLRITASKNGKCIDVYLYDPLRETKLNVFLAYDVQNGDSDNDTETLLIYGN